MTLHANARPTEAARGKQHAMERARLIIARSTCVAAAAGSEAKRGHSDRPRPRIQQRQTKNAC